MKQHVDLTSLRGLAEKILTDKSGRTRWLREFEALVWNTEEDIGNAQQDEVLRDLAVDLAYYEPDPQIRKEDPSFFGDDRLEAEITSALRKLDALHAG